MVSAGQRRLLVGAVVVAGACLAAASGAAAASAHRTFAPPPSGDQALAEAYTQPSPDKLTQLRANGRLTTPEYALQRARSLFSLAKVRKEYGYVRAPAPGDATPILLRLALMTPKLTGQHLREADTILARPSDGDADPHGDGWGGPALHYTGCIPRTDAQGHPHTLCVHWLDATEDAPPLTDLDADDIPDQVNDTFDALVDVWSAEIIQLGYRPPLGDAGGSAQGSNDGLDIYLADVGAKGLDGYCASDPLPAHQPRPRKNHAFCVLDNDYDPSQFPAPETSGLPALQITVAHEFFHAVQFAYEFSSKDAWLKEGTAVWMEDQVFDSVNAHYDFLPSSPLAQPEIPLDLFQSVDFGENFQYGSFIFFQFLAEYFNDRDVIRQIWERTAPTKHSDPSALSAIAKVVKGRNPIICVVECDPGEFRQTFGEFGLWGDGYYDLYSEGDGYYEALGELATPFDAIFTLTGSRRDTGWLKVPSDHLSTRKIGIATTSLPPGAHMRLMVDLPDRDRGPIAFGAGSHGPFLHAEALPINGKGKGSLDLPSADDVGHILMVNTSSNHDNEAYRFRARVIVP
jgi:hypothetical protein